MSNHKSQHKWHRRSVCQIVSVENYFEIKQDTPSSGKIMKITLSYEGQLFQTRWWYIVISVGQTNKKNISWWHIIWLEGSYRESRRN